MLKVERDGEIRLKKQKKMMHSAERVSDMTDFEEKLSVSLE